MSRKDCRSENAYALLTSSGESNGRWTRFLNASSNINSGSSVPSICKCNSALGMLSMKLFTGFIVSYLPPGQDGAGRTACRSPRGSQVLCTPVTLTRTLPIRKGSLLHFPQQKVARSAWSRSAPNVCQLLVCQLLVCQLLDRVRHSFVGKMAAPATLW